MSLPPVFAASALYDSLLQAALRQFFGRATFETEPIPSLSSDGRLAIEPTNDPSVLTIRWFGTRHVLHVPASRPFTSHEVRLARAIGAVLAARYRAIFDPKQMLERADLVAGVIEVLRVAALSSYENRAISSGVLLLDGQVDPARTRHADDAQAYRYTQALTGVKSFFRVCDGIQTQFLVNGDGLVLDIVDLSRWSRESGAAA